MKKLIFISLILITVFMACENQDVEFSDYKYTTVYFAYQTPIRTLVLGKDLYDNTLDNAHKCKIMATMGGVYENKEDRTLDVVVDNSLCDKIIFATDSSKILPMPAEYYSLDNSMQIVIPSGEISGGIEVQFNDAFFADPKSVSNTYVIPLLIKSVTNADSILSGKGLISNANRFVPAEWSVEPKNYVLYCVKYINPWHGAYLRRGIDVGKGNSDSKLDTTIIYHNKYVERDQVVYMKTVSMNEISLSLNTRNRGNYTDIPFELRLVFDNENKCTVMASESATYSVSGNGQFVTEGDMWGNEKRDVIHLNYKIDFGTSTHSLTDTIVMRDRSVKFETFTTVLE